MNTRTQILSHGETLARTRGFDAFSYADLSKALGIQKASIHYHFAAKADLASAMLERYAKRFMGRLEDISATDGTAAQDLIAFVQLYRDALEAGTHLCLCVSFSAARDSFNEETLARLTQFHEDSLSWLTGVFEKAQRDGSVRLMSDPQDEAAGVLAAMEGAQLLARAAVDPSLFDRAVAPLRGRCSPKT